MAKAVQKIALSASRDIPFDRLVLSQANVRRIKAGVSIEELAEDIARRTLLQSLTVRPVLDETGAETGMFEIPAGGRRYRALELLVRQKRLARNAPIPCVVRTSGIAEEDSLAENIQRAPLHPLDQFRAFQTLRVEKGQSEEEIAAAFFVSVHVVKQRLRLAAVSPQLLEVYAEDGMTLDQLMAFTVSPDHERQEQVWEAIQRSYNKEPSQIRRMLTEGAVRASDKRAQYAGVEYIAAGGAVMRDLFQQDDGGWFEDVGLLERVVAEKLERDAASIRAEGWKWVEVNQNFPYGHTYGLRLITGAQRPLTEEEAAMVEALEAEAVRIEEEFAGAEELSEEADQRLGEIEAALAAVNERPAVYEASDIANAGVFVSIDGSGRLRVERGYVRPEDEPALPASEGEEPGDPAADTLPGDEGSDDTHSDAPGEPGAVDNDEDNTEEDAGRPLSDRLLAELTAYRTLALREVVGNDPGIAMLAALHVLCLRLFYRYALSSCLEIDAKSVTFGSNVPGLADTALAERVDARHRAWAEQLPQDVDSLWDVLIGFDSDSRDALFAHCVSLTVNAVHDPYVRRPRALAHAGQLAEITTLDMVAAGWTPTAENYFGRVTKARILEAVREARGDEAAQRLTQMKKGDMVTEAERMLTGTGWLPEALRTVGVEPLKAPGIVAPAEGADSMIEGAEPEREQADVVQAENGPDIPVSETPVAEPDADHPHGIAAE